MKISVSTGRTDFKYFKECGFEALDFQLGKYFKEDGIFADIDSVTDEQIEKTFTEIKKQADEAGIEIFQTHSQFIGHIPKDDPDLVMTVKKEIVCIKATHYLGAKYCVIHPPIMRHRKYDRLMKENFDLAIDFYSKLSGTLEEYDVYCCTENMFKQDELHMEYHRCPTICSRASEMMAICEKLGRRYKICLDVGHAVLTQDNPVDMIYDCKDRLACLHLHDNDGMNDLHTFPFMRQDPKPRIGYTPMRVNWQEIMKALADIGYDGALNFETGPMGPKELEKDSYLLLVAIEKYLIGLYNK